MKLLTTKSESTDAGCEKSRLASREATKRAIASATLVEERVGELQRQIAGIDAEVDQETAKHGDATAGIQAELDEIRQRRVAELVKGEPVDSKVEKRRIELLNQLDQHNKSLALAVAAADKRKHDLQIEINRERQGSESITVLKNKLAGELAHPDLLDAKFILDKRLESLQSRMREAARHLEASQKMLQASRKRNELTNIEIYTSRVRRYTAELRASTDEHNEVVRLIEEAFQQRVAE